MDNLNINKLLIVLSMLITNLCHATGLVSLPAAGFAITGGTSAYTLCNTTGTFGYTSYAEPGSTANNACAVFPPNINTSPVSGFTLVPGTSVTRNITNPAGIPSEVIAFLDERVFRNASNTECIYAKRVRMNTSSTVTQSYTINDVALGGFSGTTTPQAGYYYAPTTTDSVVYRIGRAYTSVQYKPNAGYLTQPLISPAPVINTEINGPGQPGNSATAAQQSADIRTNWVDFTINIDNANYVSSPYKANSSLLYVRASCTQAAPVALANSVKLRQTGQGSQPFLTISTTGFARSGSNTNF